MALQVCEVWDEISRELISDGVRPVSPDEEALRSIAKVAGDTAARVMAEQISFLEQQEKEIVSEEERMYKEVLRISLNIFCVDPGIFLSQLKLENKKILHTNLPLVSRLKIFRQIWTPEEFSHIKRIFHRVVEL